MAQNTNIKNKYKTYTTKYIILKNRRTRNSLPKSGKSEMELIHSSL